MRRFAHRTSAIPNPVRLIRHWRKLLWLSVGIVALSGIDVLLTKYGPGARIATVETGASFSVSAGSFASEARAAIFAAALDASGLPMFVRARTDDGRHQVLVGPYVSTDEAEHAQRRLAAWGLGDARLVVDDTMRTRPQEAAVFGFGEPSSNNIVMLAAPGMASIVFEMRGVPKEVEARRTGATSIDVIIGRTEAAAAFERLSVPDGVVLVRDLFVRTGDAGAMLAHVVVPEGVENRLRLEGRRVYLDLAFEKAPWRIPHVAPPADRPPTQVVAAAPSNDEEELNAIVARFKQIEPFLLSAADAPEPDVLAALAHSVDDVRAGIEKVTVPASVQPTRQGLVIAVARASAALGPAFVGDRAAAIREAVALFDATRPPDAP